MKAYFIFAGILCALVLGACTVQKAVSGIRTGNIAPEISATDPGGNIINLSSQRGKYVLIEFWEAGNSQARKNHFEMGRMYQKYRDENFKDGTGFTIYSISIDSDKAKWLSAIKEDIMVWPSQVIDTDGWNAKPLLDYAVASLPKYYLLNGEGIILQHNIIISDLETILKSYIE
ncbi:MAG: TlpA family protein disulfide reductase [Bacteroidetes bacterium]|nr:TlpA family protein disulfide reductase [Bacteroidota bacterium]